MYHTEEIPTCALFIPSSFNPVAYSMACEAPCDLGCVTVAETLLRWESELSDARREEVDDMDRLNWSISYED